MITVKSWLAAAAVFALSFAPTLIRAETPVAVAAQDQVDTPSPPMWVIRDADSTVYLLGTIHAMRDDADWFTPTIRQRLEASDSLWLEVADMDDTARLVSITLPLVKGPANGLTQGLTAAEIADLDRYLASFGYRRDQMMGMRPWAVALILIEKQFEAQGVKMANGIDMTLLRHARASDKSVEGFETIEEQLGYLIPDDPRAEADMLRATLKELDAGPELLDSLVTAWLHGDIATLERYLIRDMKRDDPKGYKRMLVQRNRNWVPKIETILAGEGTVFIAVGGGHLLGPDSVIALLRRKGIKTTRIETTP